MLLTLWAAAPAARAGVAELAGLPLDALLDTQITGASRTTQRLSEAAASASVITAAEIRALGYRTLADALRAVRGLNVNNDRSYSYLGVRGVFAPGDYNTRVLLLIDGNRVNDNLYDQAYIGTESPIDIDLVERIEFIPGQGSAVYGANAFFGVINVITRAPAATRSQAAFVIASGQRREGRVTLAGRPAEDTAWTLSLSRQTAEGNDLHLPGDATGSPGMWTHGTDFEHRSSLYARVDSGPLQTSLVHMERDKGIGAPVEMVHGDSRNRYQDTLTLIDFTLRQPLGTSADLTARAYAGRYRFVGDYVIDYPPPTVNRDDDVGRWWGVEARLATTPWSAHALQFGIDAQRSSEMRFRNADLDAAATTYLDANSSADRAALFAEDRIALSPDWSLTVGGRLDRRQGLPTQASPRLALIWRPSAEWVLKGIYGSAFRPPNAYEMGYQVLTPGGYRRNPALRPEHVRGGELVAEWTPREDTRLTASGYDSRARDLTVLAHDAATDLYSFHNAGALRIRGMELEGERRWADGRQVRANLSRQHARGSAGESYAQQSAQSMLKLLGIAPLAADWTLGLEAQALGRRGAAPGYALANITLSAPAGPGGVRITGSVYNLFDRAYSDPGSSPALQPTVAQDGRNWRLRLELPF